MADEKKIPLLSEETPKEPPPTYEDSANQHNALPTRSGPPSSNTTPKPPLPRGPFPLDIPVLNQLRGKRIILASASPRRKQILSLVFPNMEIIPSTTPENLNKTQLGPFDYVHQTAIQKCLSVYQSVLQNTSESTPDPALVISADTIIVTTSGLILEKPRNEKEHIAMLKMLRDQKIHRCYTAVAVLAPREDARFPGYNLESRVEETKVWFEGEVGDELIEAYVRTREGVDKAGGYGIQGLGGLLVEKVEGSWDNVVGLPLRVTVRLVEKAVLSQGEDGEEWLEEDEEEE